MFGDLSRQGGHHAAKKLDEDELAPWLAFTISRTFTGDAGDGIGLLQGGEVGRPARAGQQAIRQERLAKALSFLAIGSGRAAMRFWKSYRRPR